MRRQKLERQLHEIPSFDLLNQVTRAHAGAPIRCHDSGFHARAGSNAPAQSSFRTALRRNSRDVSATDAVRKNLVFTGRMNPESASLLAGLSADPNYKAGAIETLGRMTRTARI